MIIFDLACRSGGHVFEAWFGSSEDFHAQQERGQVTCPLCGCGEIDKAPMAPRLSGTSREAQAPEPKLLLAKLAAAQARALQGSTWVGENFSRQARAMHDGTAEQRKVHGIATPAEARALVEEGIPVAPLPLPVLPPEESN